MNIFLRASLSLTVNKIQVFNSQYKMKIGKVCSLIKLKMGRYLGEVFEFPQNILN